jgi:hypothetical protein
MYVKYTPYIERIASGTFYLILIKTAERRFFNCIDFETAVAALAANWRWSENVFLYDIPLCSRSLCWRLKMRTLSFYYQRWPKR